MKMKLLVALCSSIVIANTAHGSINQAMDDTFNSMINTTSPKVYDSARRGVLSGGSVFIKNPTKRVNIISATAPSISAGCGGIDLFGGSFSFINADQFVETFQAIGANAIGYGVKLALTSACQTCEQVMTSLEKTAQAINSLNIDSCNAAQGIVDAAIDYATTSQADVAAKTEGVSSGFMTDISEAWSWATTSGKSATQEIEKKKPNFSKEEIKGNIAWRAFKKSNLANSLGIGNEDAALELIMTITGTVIVDNPEQASDEESDPKLTVINGYGVTLQEIINGTSDGNSGYKVLTCNDSYDKDGCLKVSSAPTKQINDIGLKERIYKAYAGNNGVIEAYQNDTEWNEEAKSVLGIASISTSICNQKIYQSVIHGMGDTIGIQIATLCSSQMALDASYSKVMSYIKTASSSIRSAEVSPSQEKAKVQLLAVLEQSEASYRREYEQLSQNINTTNLLTIINNIKFGDGQTSNL